ncbi:Co2+/Mg2+ efflux protein ApaG [Nevskia ramosa]|uniref:Co2+/Mg2+ efflux protein ApaG n=1 Tax=Nevskia ramosa TaxID=64002 RepID=UPI0025FD8C24|nr:Co2+/Mg2+ efflux protein ApaG [uncultured Nevskia sp.]
MTNTLTRGVRVIVAPRYVPEQSEPSRSHYLFSYQVTIRNDGDETVQLLSRHWIITNGEGKTEEVRGPGVIGFQPKLEPGEQFQYTSGCPLTTPVGTMHGSYQMVTDGGDNFDALIEPFRLAVPRVLN